MRNQLRFNTANAHLTALGLVAFQAQLIDNNRHIMFNMDADLAREVLNFSPRELSGRASSRRVLLDHEELAGSYGGLCLPNHKNLKAMFMESNVASMTMPSIADVDTDVLILTKTSAVSLGLARDYEMIDVDMIYIASKGTSSQLVCDLFDSDDATKIDRKLVASFFADDRFVNPPTFIHGTTRRHFGNGATAHT